MSFDPDQTRLAEALRRALNAMQSWPAQRRLEYLVMLGIKNRRAEFTRDFGGEAMPERESVATIAVPDSATRPLIKLLYVLKYGNDICLDAPTARSITGEPSIGHLIQVLKDGETRGLVHRTHPVPRELVEADRDSMVGLKLTEDGKQYVNAVLHLDENAATALR